MIHHVLSFLQEELNAYLKLKNGISEDKLVLSNVATQEGNWAIPNNKLGLSLINIEEERVFKEQRSNRVNNQGVIEYVNPEIKLNLFVIVTANYTSGDNDSNGFEYKEGLKQLSHVITFFQEKHVFTPANSPALTSYDPSIQKLVVELYSYSFEQLYNFWSVIGAKYLPSVLYRIRMLTVQSDKKSNLAPGIINIEINTVGSS